MADDGFIQVPADSVGKKVDTTEIVRPITQEVVERQRMEVYDPDGEPVATSDVVAQVKETNELLLLIIEKLDLILEIKG